MKEHSIDIQLSHPDDLFHLFGSNERHLRLMEEELDVVIHARTEIVQVLGEETACEEARQVIQALMVLVNRGMTVGTPDVVTAISMVKNDEIDKFVALYEEEIIKDNTGTVSYTHLDVYKRQDKCVSSGLTNWHPRRVAMSSPNVKVKTCLLYTSL